MHQVLRKGRSTELLKQDRSEVCKEEDVSKYSHPLRQKIGNLLSGEERKKDLDGMIPGVKEVGSPSESPRVKCKLTPKVRPVHPSRSPPPRLSFHCAGGQTAHPPSPRLDRLSHGNLTSPTRTSQRVYYTLTAHLHTHTQASH